jgi:4-amino-4-deoxy-L-arabinose transferase-like glycosyltransferase
MNKRFYIFLAAITLFRLFYAIFLPLAPQEAYYWNYSRHPALSYFDHPPITAYLIKLTTLFGASAFTIHLAAILLSILMTIAIYRLASLLFDERVGLWSAIAINLTFIYALGALIITPDSPMMLFWALSMIACYKIDRGEGYIWWILLGILLGAGFASKYSIVFAMVGGFLFFISSRSRARWWTTGWPYLALISMLITALPVIYWNYAHHWASFAFQTSSRLEEMKRFRPDMFLGYFGTLLAVYGIIPVPLLIAGISSSVKQAVKSESHEHMLIAAYSLPLPLVFMFVSLRSWVKMNWTAPAFVGWFIAAVAYYHSQAPAQRWIRAWGKISLAFLLFAFAVTHIAVLMPDFYMGKQDFLTGWDKLAARVDAIREEMPEPYFIAASEYKISSELAFHLKGRPETMGTNFLGVHGLQYDFWSDPDTLVGRNAIYIYDRCPGCPTFKAQLKKLFAFVREPDILPIEKGGHILRHYYVYRCYNYIGLKGGY